MFGNWGLGRVHTLFAEQFEPDGAGFLYRKSRKGAPIAVSAEERARFIAAYGAFILYGFWIMLGAIVAVSFAAAGIALTELEFAGTIFLLMALFTAANYWAWNAPMRALRGRGFAGSALSREDAARQTFSRITWSQLGLGLLFAAYLLIRYGAGENWELRRDGLWLGMAGVVILVIFVQAFRKWRIERSAR